MRQLTLCTGNLRKARDKFFSDNFFSDKKVFFFDFFSDWILSQTEFLSRTGFCFGLHTAFVFRMQSFKIVIYAGKCIALFLVHNN